MQKTSKQLAIEKAYGKYFVQLESFIDENGYINKIMLPKDLPKYFKELLWEDCDGLLLPDELLGIETNNGWTSVEEKGKPSKPGTYTFLAISSRNKLTTFFDPSEHSVSNLYTHYKLSKEDPLPIY